jgi:tRNA(Ile)-lysidine synthase
MTNKVENVFQEFPWPEKVGRILVGVSGGADSVVLVHLLRKFGYEIGIGHCHFNLRGEDADTDQKFVENLAHQLQVPYFTVKFDTQVYATTRKISIQMAARNLRYYWFAKIAKENEFSHIAVGTHLTDNIETFLLNATKGTGLSGLRGIKPINGNILRPLLGVGKTEIYQYAKENGLSWREDLSNQSIKYQRNKIRLEILPILEEINPNLEATFQRNFKRLGRVDAFVQSEVERYWNTWKKEENRTIKIRISDIQSHPFADVVLSYKLGELGFNSTHVEDLLQAINGQPGSVISSKDYHIFIDRSEILIQEKRFTAIPDEYSITEFLGEISQPIALKFVDQPISETRIIPDLKQAYFDFDSLVFPLKLRKWKAGDKLQPFGMKGQKKVSDVLVDVKMPLPEKENVWVLESAGEIIWVVGIRSSEKYKITKSTERVYAVKLV